HLLAKALQLVEPQISQLEQASDQALGSGADHHLVRSGEGLKTSGEVWRFADYGLFLRCTFADQIAHHHLTGFDANPAGEHFALWRVLLRDRLDHGQTRPDRPLGLVLMCSRPAKIDEDAIAHVLGNEAVVAADRSCDAAMIGTNYLA